MSLDTQQHSSIAPEFLQVVVVPLVRREGAERHVAVVEHELVVCSFSSYISPFLIILLGCFEHSLRQGVQHAVAGAVADDEIIRK